ncbi:MAG: PKD domain-containing protein, partial [Bacteroidia bacterium]|nr:PKD domain-containing protein [Bacteroidia bacterium]
NKSLHITFQPCSESYQLGVLMGNPDYSDEYSMYDASSNTDQIAMLGEDINTIGRCDIRLTAQFFLGGDANRALAYGTILYSINGGVTWKTLQDNMGPQHHLLAGTCNNWERRSWILPAECENIPNLRIAFRFRNESSLNYSLNSGFNVDNITLETLSSPTANFLPSVTNICQFSSVLFYNTTTTPAGALDTTGSFTWTVSPNTVTFVGGTNANSVQPQIQFNAPGSYTVTLNVVGSCGGSDVETKTNVITVISCPPTVNFNVNQTQVCALNPPPTAGATTTVQFTDISTSPADPIVAWFWSFSPATVNFVSGTNANSQNPVVSFQNTGPYSATLTVTTAGGGSFSFTRTNVITAINCECTPLGGGNPVLIFFEDFNGGGTNWGTANVPISGGANANFFSIGCQETGTHANGTCNTSNSTCNATTNSLYITNTLSFFFPGAAYNAGNPTQTSSYSANFSTVGQTGLQAVFNYVHKGELNIDTVAFGYSINNGPFVVIQRLAQTPSCGASTARWQTTTINLPVACENQANLRIGFRWGNNGAGGADPSFAVDSIRVFANATSSNAIATCAVNSPICPGSTFFVTGNSVGTYNPGNQFQVQLSNASGSFASPTTIGTINLAGSNLSILVSGTIPIATPPGNGYLIRIVSTNPAITGTP